MSRSPFIAGDWGTTRLRLMLCNNEQTLECREGPGIAQMPVREPAAYWRTVSELAAPWIQEQGALPIWLSGMVGSRNGWVEVPYIDCPAGPDSIAASLLRLTAGDHEIAIVIHRHRRMRLVSCKRCWDVERRHRDLRLSVKHGGMDRIAQDTEPDIALVRDDEVPNEVHRDGRLVFVSDSRID